ncbi:MAG: GWxTD domain-containing protein [Candidatus Krumholzibacteria bacterium]|nr:GWxTD domain-containing protein [Candidatus Krumholzibacteria bacterium]
MAVESRRFRRFVRSHTYICYFTLLLLMLPGVAGAMLHPLDGAGNFHAYVDVVNRWVTEDRLDVLVLVEVANGDLKYNEEDGGYVGRMRLEIQLESSDGQVISQKRHIRTETLTAVESSTRTLFQVFGLVLEDVPFRSGRLDCQIYDVNRRRAGILNQAKKRSSRSECSTAWAAENAPRTPEGIALEDPLFLVHAPFDEWNPETTAEASGSGGWLHDYTHPSRRYGLEQDRLQIFQPVWPRAGGIAMDDENLGLRVQIVSMDMEYVINDTIRFDRRGRAALAAGRPSALFYELDVNLLPEGAYRMSLAPLGGQGRGSLVDFDVVWRLEALGRHRSQILGEGRTVLEGKDLKEFLAASPAEQEKLLDHFWESLNPDPESPVNAVYLEFQYRLAYVRNFLGGFGQFGANDDRGEVFLLIGPADEVQLHHMPMNFRDQDDARIKVYNRFAPDREGTEAKGGSAGGTQGIDPYQDIGGIPMPYSRRAESQRQTQVFSPTHNFAFELWKYDDVGNTLFPNRFSRKGMGQRFLFVDRTGSGDYSLESSNVLQGEE